MDAQEISRIVEAFKEGSMNFAEASLQLVLIGLSPDEVTLLLDE